MAAERRGGERPCFCLAIAMVVCSLFLLRHRHIHTNRSSNSCKIRDRSNGSKIRDRSNGSKSSSSSSSSNGSTSSKQEQQRIYVLFLLCLASSFRPSSCRPPCAAESCSAMALYLATSQDVLSTIAKRFNFGSWDYLQAFNNLTDVTSVHAGEILKIPFSCECDRNTSVLLHSFTYTTKHIDEVDTIPEIYYGNLTTVSMVQKANPDVDFLSLQGGQALHIPIICSCGDPSVSDQYGLFGTYSVQENDTLAWVSSQFGISPHLIMSYNPSVSFDPFESGSIIFIPSKNSSGQYPPYLLSSGYASAGSKARRKITLQAGVGAACFVLFILGFVIVAHYRHARSTGNGYGQNKEHNKIVDVDSSETIPSGILKNGHCIQFSHEDIVAMTQNFNPAYEIGKGGFGIVYYGVRRGQKLAIKMMNKKDEKEFMNEINILSTVHHANLVSLIGFCKEFDHRFLAYEFVDNGTLFQHLQDKTLVSWEKRIRIALDAARGVEYMHDHTSPAYIHRDLKTKNILLDTNYRAKVGDFGLSRPIRPGGDGMTKSATMLGTHGYMAPEYVMFRHVSEKLDVYAFGVILFELVSGKEALIEKKTSLVELFRAVLEGDNAVEEFKSLVDPGLENGYPVEALWKVVQLAEMCTNDDPDMRPQMRDVALELTMVLQGSYDTRSHDN